MVVLWQCCDSAVVVLTLHSVIFGQYREEQAGANAAAITFHCLDGGEPHSPQPGGGLLGMRLSDIVMSAPEMLTNDSLAEDLQYLSAQGVTAECFQQMLGSKPRPDTGLVPLARDLLGGSLSRTEVEPRIRLLQVCNHPSTTH